MRYVVQAGDTLATIARRFNTTVEAIVRANNIANPNVIFIGQIIIIPGTPTPAPPVPPGPPFPPPPPPIPPGPPSPVLCPELRIGARGPAVRNLQNLLVRAGQNPGPIDGIFGPKTEAAVRAFQSARGLAVTGVVNVATWVALGQNCGILPPGPPVPPFPLPPPGPMPPLNFCPVLRLGSVGPAVRLLQRLLKERGFYPGIVDGSFGVSTQGAVREFQRSQGLTPTGVVDVRTWEALGICCCLEPKPPAGTPIATAVGRGIRHILFTDKRVYRRGERIKITLSKTNITHEEVNLRYNTSQIIEITATNSSGQIVWRYSDNRSFAQFSRLITIFPGGTQVIEETWDQLNSSGVQVQPGRYTITMRNLATNVSLSVQIQIQ